MREHNDRFLNNTEGFGASSAHYLCYMDQASFMGLRALGRQPLIVFTWRYLRKIDPEAVHRFNAALAETLLGRLLQRSPLPWGRHHWIAQTRQEPVVWFTEPLPRNDATRFRERLSALTVDPEHGPGWRIAVQEHNDGCTSMALIVSHTIADGGAVIEAIRDAIHGVRRRYSNANRRKRLSSANIISDCRETIRTVPELIKTIGYALKAPRLHESENTTRPAYERLRRSDLRTNQTILPAHLQITFDAKLLSDLEIRFDVRLNTLLLLFTTQLALRMGRINHEGKIKIVTPVSDRQPDDSRGNALRVLRIMVDPQDPNFSPKLLQNSFVEELAKTRENGDDLAPFLPLVPFIPLMVARHLERHAFQGDHSVGCSILGKLPIEFMSIGGTAESLFISTLEVYKEYDLDALQGLLLVIQCRTDEKIFLTISGHQSFVCTSRDSLVAFVYQAMRDIDLDHAACLDIS